MRVPQLADPRWGPSGPTHSTYWLRSHEVTHSLQVSTSGRLRMVGAGERGPRSAGLGLWPQRTTSAELEFVALVWSWVRLVLLSGDGWWQPPGAGGQGWPARGPLHHHVHTELAPRALGPSCGPEPGPT